MIKRAVKQLLSKMGYTIIKTKLEEVEKMIPPPLPANLFENSRVCNSREDVLQWLPKGGVIAEVGVAYGNFSALLLEQLQPEKFIVIDSFAITGDTEPWKQTVLKDSKMTHLEYYQNKFHQEIDKGQVVIYPGLSWEMLAKLPDKSIDYLYLDAGHSYEEVVKDIEQVSQKIKDNGIIQFNDYTLFDCFAFIPYGVPKAVHEFMLKENYELLFLCLHRQFFCDVVLRRKEIGC
ncbi:MAG: class SAM-dependent methyltransferase [Chitinophagaceae bacterium]|nr:class SAM-dependent methyltransferase [Chitinophagaceae bacterium]